MRTAEFTLVGGCLAAKTGRMVEARSGMDGWHAGSLAGAELAYQCQGTGLTRAQYFRMVAELLERLVPGETVAWNGVDLAAGAVDVIAFPESTWAASNPAGHVAAVMDDHPMAISYLTRHDDRTPRRISDLISRSAFRRTRTYAELFRVIGAENQLTILTSSADTSRLHCWSVNRKRSDFDDEDMERATAVQAALIEIERATFRAQRRALRDDLAERFRLTPQELRVLGGLVDGLTAVSIGRLLRISPATARKHLENVYRKLDCHDRLQAVLVARAGA